MRWALCLALTSIGVPASNAQTRPTPSIRSDETEVRDADAAFWRAFNVCDAGAMSKFFADDVEFYHDITGLTRSRDAVAASLMTGPCKTKALRVRRALVAASVRYDPVPGYGAILAGEHLFYARRGDGPEKLETRASFTVVWRHRSGQWLMTRIVSYDHRPIAYVPSSQGIAVPLRVLQGHVGRYRTAASGDIAVTLEGGALILRSGGMRVTLAASAPDRFFAIERDLRFAFTGAPASQEVKIEENGAVVATGVRVDAPD